MGKLYSLLRACMTSDMSLFKIKTKKNSKISTLIPMVIAIYLMLFIWGSANSLFEKVVFMHIQYVFLSIFVFGISIMTFIEGIYKSGPLMFNCKDDDLLFSLPIERRTVLFVRIFKFYIFELLFNSLFLLPIMIAYIRWAEYLSWTYFLSSLVMLFMLPIIPIVLSCIIGIITSGLVSKFKYKNIAQIIISMTFLVFVLYISYNVNNLFKYFVKHATSMNDVITKIYYPAGVYAKLVTNFNIIDLLMFVLINISIFVVVIFILSKFYFKINSNLKRVTINKKTNITDLVIRAKSKNKSLINKELSTFFKIPVFIINAGFALLLFILATIVISFKFDSVIPFLTDSKGFNLSKDLIMDNLSLLIFALISITAYMTSITNSVISLEGRNINIIKSLPISTKTILMSKIYSSLILTTPVLLMGDIVLFIKFRINVIDMLLLIVLSILIPLVSHFIGLIVNLKYPKLDAENSTEVVKQSTSSFLSVMIGMILLMISIVIIIRVVGKINSTLVLIMATILYILIDTILYLYLITRGVKDFNRLSV